MFDFVDWLLVGISELFFIDLFAINIVWIFVFLFV